MSRWHLPKPRLLCSIKHTAFLEARHIRRSQHEAIHRYQCSVPSNHCYGYLETFQEALL